MLTDGHTDERTDGRKVITIAHPEHSSGELKTFLPSYIEIGPLVSGITEILK